MFLKSIALLVAAVVTLANIVASDLGASGDALHAESRIDRPVAKRRQDFPEGNAHRGRELFLLGNLARRACHSLEPGDDSDAAPTLFGIGSRATREENREAHPGSVRGFCARMQERNDLLVNHGRNPSRQADFGHCRPCDRPRLFLRGDSHRSQHD